MEVKRTEPSRRGYTSNTDRVDGSTCVTTIPLVVDSSLKACKLSSVRVRLVRDRYLEQVHSCSIVPLSQAPSQKASERSGQEFAEALLHRI
jgi:hypothetical protein